MSNLNDFKNLNTVFSGSGGIRLPVGTTTGTTGRPNNAVEGLLRYNSVTGLLEFYSVSGWSSISSGSGSGSTSVLNLDGGTPSSNYGGVIVVQGGTP